MTPGNTTGQTNPGMRAAMRRMARNDGTPTTMTMAEGAMRASGPRAAAEARAAERAMARRG